jgi:hypothetical protein
MLTQGNIEWHSPGLQYPHDQYQAPTMPYAPACVLYES